MSFITVQILNSLNSVDIIDSDNSTSRSVHNSPKITYITEPKGVKFEDAKRVIAIAYSYNKDTVKYGASIFRKLNKTDFCVKSQIRTTAIERFNKCPVTFSIGLEATNGPTTVNDIIHSIRFKMYKYGVKSKEQPFPIGQGQNQELKSEENNQVETSSSTNSEEPKERLPRISYILEPRYSTWANAQRIIAIAYSYDNNLISFGILCQILNQVSNINLWNQVKLLILNLITLIFIIGLPNGKTPK